MARTRRQTKTPPRPGTRSATKCGKTPLVNSKTVSNTAMVSVKEDKQADQGAQVENSATEELICAICTDIYRNPKLLQCVHTFCGECIQQVMEHQNDHLKIVCPICRYVTKAGPDGNLKLLRNHIIEQKVKWHEVSLERETNGFRCVECEAEVASMLCRDCPLKLCDSCAAHHKRCVRTKEHSIVSIEAVSNEDLFERNLEHCSEHGQKLKLFCETCQGSICSDCTHSKSHRQHLFLPLHEATEKQLKSLNKVLGDTENSCKLYEDHLCEAEQFNRKVSEERENSKILIEDSVSELTEILQDEKRKMFDWLDKDAESSNNALQLAREKVDHVKNRVSYLREVSRHSEEQISDVIKAGMSQLKGVIKSMSKSAGQSTFSNSKKQDEADEFNVVIRADHLEMSNQFVEIKSSLKNMFSVPSEASDVATPSVGLGHGCMSIRSMFPAPQGTIIFSVTFPRTKTLTSPQQQIGDFFWTLKVKKHTNGIKGFDDDDSVGCYVQCVSSASNQGTWRCRAYSKIIFKSSIPGGKDLSFTNGTRPLDFRSKNPPDSWGKTFKNAGLTWRHLLAYGLLKGQSQTMEIHATVKIESWEGGPS